MKAINIYNQPAGRYLRGLDRSRFGDLCRDSATPFMILRTEMIRGKLNRLRQALPRADVYYAVKANNHPAVTNTLIDENCRFDISSASELNEIIAAGGRADQVIHPPAPVRLLVFFGVGRGQSQAKRCRRHQGRLTPTGRGQVMYLVKDDQLNRIALFGDEVARRMVGGYGQRQDGLLATVVHADVCLEGVGQPGVPLV